MDFENAPVYVLIVGFFFLAITLAYLLALLLRLCSRITKVPLPGWGIRYVAAIFQVIAGAGAALIHASHGHRTVLGNRNWLGYRHPCRIILLSLIFQTHLGRYI